MNKLLWVIRIACTRHETGRWKEKRERERPVGVETENEEEMEKKRLWRMRPECTEQHHGEGDVDGERDEHVDKNHCHTGLCTLK